MYMSSLGEGQPLTSAAAGAPGSSDTGRCTFHDARRCSWTTLGAIAAGHALLLAGLVMFDVIPLAAKPKHLSVQLVPVEIAPPPPPSAAPTPKQRAIETPVVAPPPIVQVPAPPPQVTVTPIAPPVQPVAVAVPSVVDAPSPAPPAPVAISRLSPLPGNPPLKYPAAARMKRHEGVVRLRILVAADGSVADIAIAQSSGFDSLDNAAVEVIRRWRFRAPTRDGVPQEGIGIFPASFKLAS